MVDGPEIADDAADTEERTAHQRELVAAFSDQGAAVAKDDGKSDEQGDEVPEDDLVEDRDICGQFDENAHD